MQVRHKLLVVGGLIGALLGVAAALLYIRSNEDQIVAVESGEVEAMNKISTREVMTVGLSLVGLLRQIAGLGES